MNEENFELLLDVIVAVPEKHFDMKVWKCRTVACAIGHLCQDPRAQAKGLSLPVRGNWGATPAYKKFRGYEAVAAFLEIPLSAATYLFMPTSYGQTRPSKSVVIRRIEEWRLSAEARRFAPVEA
jgi:hypothetical protein